MSRKPNIKQNGLKLPKTLQQELGIDLSSAGKSRVKGRYGGTGSRKEQRKTGRIEKRRGRIQPYGRRNEHHVNEEGDQGHLDEADLSRSEPEASAARPLNARKTSATVKRGKKVSAEPKLQSILKKPATIIRPPSDSGSSDSSRAPSPGLVLDGSSRAFLEHAAREDAEIDRLEKRLGLKGKKLPKSFDDDGLGDLLEGLDDGDRAEKKSREGDEWLEAKRRKVGVNKQEEGESEYLDETNNDSLGSSLEEVEEDSQCLSGEESFASFSTSEDDEVQVPIRKTQRENPYVAPMPRGAVVTKYVPPSQRKISSEETESLQRLRRQLQGHLNKLSEANLISIVSDVEQLYQSNPRQEVTSVLIDLLLSLLGNRSSLQNTFVILHAGFVAAVYKVEGTDFGADVIANLVERLDAYLAQKNATSGKEGVNLVSLLSHLFVFHVVNSTLIFDYARLFLQELSEAKTELLLKVVRDCGPQLRQEDPSALKSMVQIMQSTAAKATAEGRIMTVRNRFMIETITDLKNNKMKGVTAALGYASEHIIQMRKTLGLLNSRNLRATEPLRIGLEDVRRSDKKGKWWLVGASWKGDEPDKDVDDSHPGSMPLARNGQDLETGELDLLALARQYRMNNDIRRSIFVAVMSANDYQDAHLRLLKLRLKKNQEQEIPRVIIKCASAEAAYNPYYTLIAKKLCSEKKIKMAFQFVLWDVFKRLGEKGDVEGSDADDEEQEVELPEIVNLAKMYGNLVLDGCLTIGILKVLNLALLKDQARTFVELLLLTVVTSTPLSGDKNKKLVQVFEAATETPQVIQPLQYFIKTHLRKTDLVGTESALQFKQGCRTALGALNRIIASAMDPE